MPRAKFAVTDENRELALKLASVGARQEDIGRMLGIRSTKTLRKYFREELDKGAADANNNVATAMYKMATSARYPVASIFWLKCRARWTERVADVLEEKRKPIPLKFPVRPN
jgi:hypothetical protein